MKFQHFLTVAALSAALAFGQGGTGTHGGGTPPDPAQRIGMRVDMLARLLSLTDAQKAQATTIFTAADSQSTTLRTTLRSTQQSIADAVKKNDAASIDQLSQTLGTTTGQLTAIESKANAAFYAILTPDQQAKFPARGFGGPGGPGGPGGFRGPGPGGFRRGSAQ